MKTKIYPTFLFSLLLSLLLPLSVSAQGEIVSLSKNTDGHSLKDFGQTIPGEIRFNFSGYANPQRPFPGYVGQFQLGPVRISGSGVVLGSNGKLLSGGRITHTDNLRDRRYPNHRTTWQVIQGLNVKSEGGVTVLRLLVRIVSSNYRNICPIGTRGVVELIDDNRKLPNGYNRDGIRTEMPNPFSKAPNGGGACGTHTHGMNNTTVSWTDPPRGGPRTGGQWAIVNITGKETCQASDWTGTWNTNYNRLTLRLLRTGSLSGTYNIYRHYISGNILKSNPCIFVGTWRHRNSSKRGRVRFVMKPDKKHFEGTWTDNNINPAGRSINWRGTKQ